MMSEEPNAPEIIWLPASGVQPVVYVAKAGGRPVAILQMQPGEGFELTTSSGRVIGQFSSLSEGQRALAEWLAMTGSGARDGRVRP